MKTKLLGLTIAVASVTCAQAGTVTTEGSDLIISTKSGFKVKTADKKASFQVGGRIQYDYNYSELNGENDESAFDIRRARLFVKGHYGDWGYKTQFNVSESENKGGTVEDIYIQYRGWGKAAKVTIGRAKESFGLEQLTSSKDISILERSAVTEFFTPGRNEGVQLSGKNGMFNYAAGVYEAGSEEKTDARQIAFTGRVVATPVMSNGNVVHLGLAYTDRGSDSELESALGVELAASMGSLHVQTEYFNGDTASNGSVDGYYLQAGWIITGENRPYKDGKFKRVKPQSAAGAWEVVARYESGDGNFSDIELGDTEATAYTVGLNWYATNNTRLGVNYTEGESDVNSDEGKEFRARMQYVF
jgi:phosphate-selective porin OprO and OprP